MTLQTRQGPNQGKALLRVDGSSKGEIDLYAAKAGSASRTISGLGPGPHVLSVVVAGSRNRASGGTEVAVDGFTAGGRSFADTSGAVRYGSWQAGGGKHAASAAGAEAQARFTGSSVTWVTAAGPANGRAEVLIDGRSRGTVDLYARTAAPVSRVFAGLTRGSHTITVRVLGSKAAASSGSTVVVDRFLVA